MDKNTLLGQMLRMWVDTEEKEPEHKGARPPSEAWAKSEKKEAKGKTGREWAKHEASEMLGQGAARQAGEKLKSRRQAIEDAVNEATK